MLAILAFVAFLLAAFGISTLGPVGLLALGLAFLALHFAVGYRLPFYPGRYQ